MIVNVTVLSRAIERLVAEMKEITLAAGVPAGTFERILDVDPELTLDDLENRLTFLKKTREKEYQAVLSIWRLLPATIWKRYEEFGESQLREQKLLRDARKVLRKVWRKRYGEKEAISLEGQHSSGTA